MLDSPTKIFISYARDESHGQSLATDVQQQLLGAGFDVFRDVIGLKPGESFPHRLEFELESSDLMVLVISEKVRRSEWVYNEFSLAKQLDIPVIPLLAEETRLPLWLQSTHYLNFCDERDWSLLLSSVEGHCEIPSLLERNPSSVPVETKSESMKSCFTDENISLDRRPAEVVPSWASDGGMDQYGQYADLTIEDVTQRFRLIKAGRFLMGSPEDEEGRDIDETQHEVILRNDYWLADTACTQVFWKKVSKKYNSYSFSKVLQQLLSGFNPSKFKDDLLKPVDSVSWDEIQRCLVGINLSNRGLSLRLPTEAEWEYACRAGKLTAFYWGNAILPNQVNYGVEDVYLYRGETIVVGSLPANAWGLYEMHGNVSEWCNDEYKLYSGENAKHGYKLASESDRVLRGGSWCNAEESCRSAKRFHQHSSAVDVRNGFRLAMDA